MQLMASQQKSNGIEVSKLSQIRGFDFSPVNQPVTLYVDQPLMQNKGRDFTIRVHYNIVPAG